MTNSKMSLWSLVSDMPPERFNGLFEEFPHDLRCFLGDWLEAQPWEFINNTSDSFCAVQAARLLTAMVKLLQDLANENGSPGPMLQVTANLENRYRREPLKLVETVKRILRGERAAVQEKFQHVPLYVHRQREELMFEFNLQRLQYRVQEIQALQESSRQMNNSTRVLQLQMLDPQFPMQENLHTNSLQSLQTLFLNTISELEEAQKAVLARLMIWKRQQQLAGNGIPFEEDLSPLQERLESLVNICFQLRIQLVAVGGELQSSLQERLDNIFNAFIKNSFLVDKQPPQVLKTQTKFQATVRFLLGPLLLKTPHTSFIVTADIVTEKQARELTTSPSGGVFSESSGEIVNNTAPLETNATSNACCALFKNMLLKKIKRCDRKSTESVTEEKCAVLFSVSLCLGPNRTNFHLQALSLPIVVIVHGNQDNNAKATILWDNAFAAANRIPFVVAERVSWDDMCETLNQKFMAEVQTTKGLLKEHYFFLAQKIFGDSGASPEEFQQRSVSWSQFNKELLPSRGFTFWQWFEGVLDLTKKYLKEYWSDRLIMGFISKQYVFSCLSNAPVGTFLLRFSDSEIGGISIAYVTCYQDGSTQVENIQPFTAKQLSIRSLAHCVLDLLQIQTLYPDRPKTEAFRRHLNAEAPQKGSYVPAQLRITVDLPSSVPVPSLQPQVNSMSNSNLNLGITSDPSYDSSSLMISSSRHMSPSDNSVYGSPQLHSEVTYAYSLGNESPLGPMDSYPMPTDVDMPDISLQNEHASPYATDLHMLPNHMMLPTMMVPPSDEELALLLRPEQDLNHYSQDPA
nr:signal transducer and activator of transcription 6 [Anolis sagrei ordinatus]